MGNKRIDGKVTQVKNTKNYLYNMHTKQQVMYLHKNILFPILNFFSIANYALNRLESTSLFPVALHAMLCSLVCHAYIHTYTSTPISLPYTLVLYSAYPFAIHNIAPDLFPTFSIVHNDMSLKTWDSPEW